MMSKRLAISPAEQRWQAVRSLPERSSSMYEFKTVAHHAVDDITIHVRLSKLGNIAHGPYTCAIVVEDASQSMAYRMRSPAELVEIARKLQSIAGQWQAQMEKKS